MVKRSNSSIWSGNITQFAQAATAKNDGKCRCQRAELGLFMKNTTSEGFNHRKLGFHGYKLVVYLMMIWLVISFLFSSIWGDDLIWWISRGETCWNHLPNQRRIEDLGSYGFITQLWFSGEPKNPGHRWKLWPLSLCWEGEASLRLECIPYFWTPICFGPGRIWRSLKERPSTAPRSHINGDPIAGDRK